MNIHYEIDEHGNIKATIFYEEPMKSVNVEFTPEAFEELQALGERNPFNSVAEALIRTYGLNPEKVFSAKKL